MKDLFFLKLLLVIQATGFFYIFFANYASGERYDFHISEGNNYFDLQELDKALIHYKKAVEMKKEAADAYFQIGHIHLLKGFNELALKYFAQAESHSQYFLVKETLLDLYLNMSATYHREKYWDKEIEYLKKILTLSTNKEANFYQIYAGKAFFLLGLLAINRDETAWAKEYFSKATIYPYRLKSCFLHLSHYYAITSQEKINADFKKINPQKKHSENKDVFFEYYYSKYKNTSFSIEEKHLFLKEPYRQYVKDIDEYKRQQESQPYQTK